jgi:peroxiredoxin
MVLTASHMLELGTELPPFALPDTDGRVVRAEDFRAKPLLVVFLSNHCPYVKHVKKELAQIGKDLAARGVGMVGIMSNDIDAYPADAPDKMAEDKRAFGYTFPYLFDSDQKVALTSRAACTPEHYLFDAQHRLVYRGQLDESRPNNGIPVTGRDVRNAVDALLAGKPISDRQIPSMGCNIKWKPGNEPKQ